MHTLIALFRGINVGGHHKLPMKDLVCILESLGYSDVQTYIQSGNVVFESPSPQGEQSADEISDAVEAKFGFRPNVLLLGKQQFEDAVARNPFPTAQGKFLHFFFLERSPESPDLETLRGIKTASEQFKLVDSLFYLYTPDGFGRSKLAEKVERCLGVAVTARNFNTVNAILNLL
ncbi:MAG: DUF1697 domain-containing protein [Xanthomonadales bacterium]|nr:DUF1697 domain-containing protein [Xanthomonadales bacterium]